LLDFGFTASQSNSNLFIYHSAVFTTYVLIYVDDIIITSSKPAAIIELLNRMESEFAVKQLGDLNFFLGIEVSKQSNGIILSQRRYILDILKRIKMTDAKPVSTPMATFVHLSAVDGEIFEDLTLYRSTIGAFQYLQLTRLDIAFTVNRLSQFLQNPLLPHWQATKRLLRYLKQTITFGLHIQNSSSYLLQAFSNADWAGSRDDQRSTRGYCIFLGKNLISWSCKKQATVAKSSTEAEYKALANTAAELTWLQSLLIELHIPVRVPPVLWCDNIGATYLSSNPVFRALTKHIAIDFYFVREMVASKSLNIQFLSTKDQVTDVFTKPLSSSRFSILRDKLRVVSPYLSLRGRIRDKSQDSNSNSLCNNN